MDIVGQLKTQSNKSTTVLSPTFENASIITLTALFRSATATLNPQTKRTSDEHPVTTIYATNNTTFAPKSTIITITFVNEKLTPDILPPTAMSTINHFASNADSSENWLNCDHTTSVSPQETTQVA
ncbi:unnamed protein product [Dibothriocephalus latus]|uniref:Uncharacterized protein n=1 Tax=Dibothriocephalus latus TaxID=60516 RepID=A0A3P7KX57_DIBLA|nr:unnamed protein product [Dibothriocephalus latus]